jgi:SAM-dependent methyltransferase
VACIRELWRQDHCAVLRCRACGFAFGVPFVGGDETFYAILHEQQDYPAWRWDYDVARREALPRYAAGRILDVGAGSGAFLRSLGPGWRGAAVEGSESTRQQLEAAGIQVFRDLGAASRAHTGAFQVVTLFQVLEHLSQFDDVLRSIRRLLAPGGSLVITVPDADAMIRQERMTGCPDMPPNHIAKWTPASLTAVLRGAGFDVASAIPEPASWRQVKASLHLKLITDAARTLLPAAAVYRLRHRGLRAAALACAAVPIAVAWLPRLRELRLGGAFALIARRSPSA